MCCFMFVINDEERRAFPEIWVLSDCVVDAGDKQFARLHMVIGVLIVGQFFTAIGVMVAIVGFYEAVLGKSAVLAVL